MAHLPRIPGSLAILLTPLLLLPTLAAPASAQEGWDAGPSSVPSRVVAGGGLVLGQPRGEFGDYVSLGIGLDGFMRINLDSEGWVGIRIDGGFMIYGHESQRTCLSSTVGCRIEVEVITSNNIVSGGIGPEISVPLGPLQAYGGVSAGLSWFTTDSEVKGTSGVQDPFATTRNFSDVGFAWNASSGLRIPLSRGEPAVALDLGVRWMQNGRREYLTEGDISERPDGSLELNVRRSEADLLLWRIGVSVGLPRGR
jgi:hypothetical protein